MQETSQNIDEMQAANDNVPVSVSGKGIIMDHFEGPGDVVQEQIQNTQSFLDFIIPKPFNPAAKVMYLQELRDRFPEVANDNVEPIKKRA